MTGGGRLVLCLAMWSGEVFNDRRRDWPGDRARDHRRRCSGVGNGNRRRLADGRLVWATEVRLRRCTTRTTGAELGPAIAGAHTNTLSPGGILVAASGGSIARYDTATMEPVIQFAGARGHVNVLQFSRGNGSILLATSHDQTVSVYDVATGTRLGDPLP